MHTLPTSQVQIKIMRVVLSSLQIDKLGVKNTHQELHGSIVHTKVLEPRLKLLESVRLDCRFFRRAFVSFALNSNDTVGLVYGL